MEQDIHFMRQALALAQEAADEWETPVGALIVRNGEVIATGRNRREIGKNALYHAEIEAIDNACKKLGGWRLPGCTLYVTLEPCPMCTGAIINSRIERVVFGASDLKAGSMGSVIDLTELPYNHKPAVERGILQEECAEMLSSFFKALRKHKEQIKNENSCH
ncbi:MAG: tRNA adenosine(34) deaminase TadA [Clostridia bacterium]|nr:tRNA adenosine(34) deaminase TadA [Clostridia bacterium]